MLFCTQLPFILIKYNFIFSAIAFRYVCTYVNKIEIYNSIVDFGRKHFPPVRLQNNTSFTLPLTAQCSYPTSAASPRRSRQSLILQV